MDAHTFEEWVARVPSCLREDSLWSMESYRLALFATDLVRVDAVKIRQAPEAKPYVDQLLRAVGSIGANIAEGYGRSGARDRAHYFEYALGSARESRHWYYQTAGVLSDRAFAHRLELMTRLTRMLIAAVRTARNEKGLANR